MLRNLSFGLASVFFEMGSMGIGVDRPDHRPLDLATAGQTSSRVASGGLMKMICCWRGLKNQRFLVKTGRTDLSQF
jgi:hypothetical protein